MPQYNVRRFAFALAIFGAAAVLVGVATTQHVLPGHLTATQTLQQMLVPEPRTVFGKNALHVLVVGLDYDYSAQDQETSAHSRSDIIMAVKLDFAKRRMYDLSVPRDMVATMPDGRVAKINQAQADGGVREAKTVIAQWLGAPAFDRYVVLRIDTMKDLINAIGGVTVNVENSDALRHAGPNGPVDYDDSWGHLHVHLKPGVQRLDGMQAVGYARFRHDWCSDPCRIMRQQQVIHALADEIQKHQLNTVLHIQPLLDVVRKDVETDLKLNEEISLAVAFSHLAPSDIVTAQVPYTGSIDLPGYGDSIVADEKQKQSLVTAMLTDPAPLEPDGQLLAALSPADIRVHVQNGTTVSGAAGKVAQRLRAAGFNVTAIDNASESDVERSAVSGGSADAPLAFKVRDALGSIGHNARVAYVSGDAATRDTVLVVVGADMARSFQGTATGRP